ncbi:hypothetical protein KDW20_01240 [Burkholderia cenocepacia]|uniref:hypothetical protein n=1 Tax=Burkholderia cenocepacia TaxID=95486 RepID=UPI001B95209F|nr:hypothetical protein [Burkholderia cenocepacia]MBR8374380.1 hypothetical protein [Burkholderia cenocepacia]MDI9647293.1 hypothetical protein [Burkholderia cenocepacia]
MEDKQTVRFLAQFEASKKNVAEWPGWMRDAAKVATASFPESHVGKDVVKGTAHEKQAKAK